MTALTETPQPAPPMGFADYVRIVWAVRWWLILLPVVGMIVGFGVGRAQPKVYATRATILPPREAGGQSLGAMIGSALTAGGGASTMMGGGGSSSLSTNQDLFMVLLNSRTMKDEVMAEFGKTWGKGVRSMLVSTNVDSREKGSIGLTVEATNPALAADLANYFLAHLDRMLQRFADQSARRREKLYAAQLELAGKEVEKAEQELLKFQTENRLLAPIDAPTKNSVDLTASLRGTIMGLEMQREMKRMRFTDQHPEVREIDRQIAEVKRQYSSNLYGEAMDLPNEGAGKGKRKEFFVSAAKLTPLQFSYLKLYQNFKVQDAFYNTGLQGLQQIRYGELINQPFVEVLDPAVPPGGPVRPNVRLIVMAGGVAGLVVAIAFGFVREAMAGAIGAAASDRRANPRNGRPTNGNGHAKPPRMGKPEADPQPVDIPTL